MRDFRDAKAMARTLRAALAAGFASFAGRSTLEAAGIAGRASIPGLASP